MANYCFSGQRCCTTIKRLVLILYIALLLAAAAVLTWAGLYLYFVPAMASIAPLFFIIACCNRGAASSLKHAGDGPHSDQSDPVSSETRLRIGDELHASELNGLHHPTVHSIKEPGKGFLNFQPWRPYTYAELVAATNNFDQSNLLGRGGQADVFHGVELLNDEGDGSLCYGRNIAVKRFYFVSNNAEELECANSQFLREVQVLSRASHSNVVECYGYCVHGRERLIVSELMPKGSLHDVLFPHARGPQAHAVSTLDWGQRLTIAKDAARGLDYLHNHYCRFNLVHLDIKPQNILLDEMLHAKIADFGICMLLGRDQICLTGATMVGGTLGYRAPELNCLLKGWEENITKKVDVYSFGIVLIQLASGRRVSSLPTVDTASPAFVMPGQTFRDAAFHLVKAQQTHLLMDESLNTSACNNSEVGKRMLEIGAMCVEIDPMDRPHMHQVAELLDGISMESVQ